MEFIKWMIAGALGVIVVSTNPAVTQAQDNGNGHGKGQTKHDRDDDDEHSDHYYQHHDEEAVRAWYSENERHLPPGLAKKDQLPPGLERQLVRSGSLPPELAEFGEVIQQESSRNLGAVL